MSSNLTSIEAVKNALVINNELDENYAEMYKLLQQKLIECRNKISNIVKRRANPGKRKQPIESYFILNKMCLSDGLGNTNVNNDFPFPCRVPYRWTGNDKRKFRDALHQQARKLINKELHNIEMRLISKYEQNSLELMRYKKDLEFMKNADPFILPSNADYDWDAVAKKLNRHTALECESMWHQFECPAINKGDWSRKEVLKLAELAIRYNESNWEAIAKELNTNRSPFQCFIYYLTNFKNKERKKWTEDEDQMLLRLVKELECTEGIPWTIIASKMKKNKTQVYGRWKQCLQSNLKKGRFLPEEDTVILTCIKKFGLDFQKISRFVMGRNIVQLRNRYKILHTKCSVQWTVDEDKLLVQILAGQTGTLNYSKIVHLFPGKTRCNLRIRYQTLNKFMSQHPNVDLKHAPRKGPHLLKRGKSADAIEDALTGLNKKMTKLITKYERDEIKGMSESGRKRRNSLINSIIMKIIQRQSTYTDIKPNIPVIVEESDVKALLGLWGVKPPIKAHTYSKSEISFQTISLPSYLFHQESYVSYLFPPTYSACIGCRTFLRQFRECSRSRSIAYACFQEIDFEEEWTALLNRFKQIFVLPLMLIEIVRSQGNQL